MLVFESVQTAGIAQLSYLVGDTSSGTAAVVDPRPNVDIYLELARKHGVSITHVFETHIHADFMSGARALSERTGSARIYASGEGDAEYDFDLKTIQGGDSFSFGSVTLTAHHTPGHTPEHLAYELAEKGSENRPWGVLTGDSLFVGSAGRPDLLGEDETEELTEQLFHTLRDYYLKLEDGVMIYPCHGAGSACGADIGDRPMSSIGYERRTNPFLQYEDFDEFKQFVNDGAPPVPQHYPILKKVNARGPEWTGAHPVIPGLPPEEFQEAAEKGTAQLVDTRQMLAFGGGHIPKAINIGDRPELSVWAGDMLDYDKPILLVVEDETQLDWIGWHFAYVGLTDFAGYLVGGMKAWDNAGLPLERIPQVSVLELRKRQDEFQILDVRSPDEWDQGHLSGAHHHFIGEMRHGVNGVAGLDRKKPVATFCGSGYRASIAASLMQRDGYASVHNVPGSMLAWKSAGFEVKESDGEKSTADAERNTHDDRSSAAESWDWREATFGKLATGLAGGLIFGFLLQKGGVAKFDILVGVLLLENFVVVQVMLSAIIVGMVGVYVLERAGVLEYQIKKTSYGANIIGGLIFGVGFGLLAYCPGTNAAALGQGNLDALVGVAGMLLGSYVYALSSKFGAEKVSDWGQRGKLILPDVVGLSRGWFIVIAIPVLPGTPTEKEAAICFVQPAAGPPPKAGKRQENSKAARKELAALAGHWSRVEFNAVGGGWRAAEYLLHGGKSRKLGANKPYPLQVKGSTFLFAGTKAGKATVRIDPTKNPKTIDLTDAKGRTWLGIYRLQRDELIINLGLRKKRPAKIQRAGTFGQANVVYERTRKTSLPIPAENEVRGKTRSKDVIGKVFNKTVSRHDLRKEYPVLHEVRRLFLQPVMQRYRTAHRREVQLTESEIARAIRYHEQLARRQGGSVAAAWQRSLKLQQRDAQRSLSEINRKLAQKDLGAEERKAAIKHKRRLELLLKQPGRGFVEIYYPGLKFQRHLHRTYGGGRILFQQFGPEAFDAMHRWLREREKAGDFSIADPKLRALLYQYWTDTKMHGAFLSTPKDKADPVRLRFPWEQDREK
eukprot:g33049.t1